MSGVDETESEASEEEEEGQDGGQAEVAATTVATTKAPTTKKKDGAVVTGRSIKPAAAHNGGATAAGDAGGAVQHTSAQLEEMYHAAVAKEQKEMYHAAVAKEQKKVLKRAYKKVFKHQPAAQYHQPAFIPPSVPNPEDHASHFSSSVTLVFVVMVAFVLMCGGAFLMRRKMKMNIMENLKRPRRSSC